MADAYGTIVVSWKDCEPNKAAIAKHLRNYRFSNSVYTLDEDLYFDDCMQYPTLSPDLEPKTYFYRDDKGGNYREISAADAQAILKTFDDYVEGDDPEDFLEAASYAQFSLEDWSALSAHLGGTGFIEFCAVQNEKLRYVNYERVRIYYTGEVEYEYRCSGPWVDSVTINERLGKGVYFPTNPADPLPTPQ